jgi:glutamate/tyrosine decarboxylase-like PLP-dependent enzyme
MVSLGEEGYLDAARQILETARAIREGIAATPGLEVLGNPLWVIAFASKELDIYRVMAAMAKRGWSLNGLHRPACVHLCVTLRHARPGVAERFLADLRAATEEIRARPGGAEGMAPIYGMAATLPVRGLVGELLDRYMDLIYEVEPGE